VPLPVIIVSNPAHRALITRAQRGVIYPIPKCSCATRNPVGYFLSVSAMVLSCVLQSRHDKNLQQCHLFSTRLISWDVCGFAGNDGAAATLADYLDTY